MPDRTSGLAQEIEELERRGWKALCGPHGAQFYDDLMADDGLMVFPGVVLDKVATTRAIAGEPPWARFELSDVTVVEVGADGALVTYRATSRRPGESEYRALMTTVYARRSGRWRLILHQQTPLPTAA